MMDSMASEQFLEESSVSQINNHREQHLSSTEMWKSIADTIVDSDDTPSGGFDCNICLESVQDPVVTLCGHLYCWPCIYKWLHYQSISEEDPVEQPEQQCPVCKAEVSEATLVPLFGRGQTTKPSKTKAPNLGIIIPRRPLSLACGFDSPRSPLATGNPRPTQPMYYGNNYSHQTQRNYSQPLRYRDSPMLSPGATIDPTIGMFEEMIYARVFGNSITNVYAYPNSYHLAGSSSPRVRRHVMQADRSLSRICFFLFCCVLLCFLLF